MDGSLGMGIGFSSSMESCSDRRGGEGSEEGHPLCLWDYLGREEGDDRLSFGHLRVPECLEGFLRDLHERGIEGELCEMITTDGATGFGMH